jgi:predicted transcriptional regulator
MKTAISLPDSLFHEIDDCARRLRLTRSGLLAIAARRFVAEHKSGKNATQAWNDAITKGGQPGRDPAAHAMRQRTKEIIRSQR